MINVLQEEF